MITVNIKQGQYEEYANIQSKKELLEFINRNKSDKSNIYN